MTDLLAIRTGLAAAVDSIDGVHGYAHRVASPEWPCGVVAPPNTVEYLRGHASSGLELVVSVYVSTNVGLGAADALLDELMSDTGARSVPLAIRDAAPPAGAWREAVPITATNWREQTLEDDDGNVAAQLVAADLIIRITTTKE